MPTPRYKLLVDRLAADIRSGRLAPGTRLPTHRKLAAKEGLALVTASRVYAELNAMGLVSGETGRGTFVKEALLPRAHGIDQVSVAADIVDLNFNYPALPEQADLLRTALRQLSQAGDLEALLRYQPHGGRRHERASVARHLARRGLCVTDEQVMLVDGAQHGLATTVMALLQPGDVVAVDALTYPGFKLLAQAHRLELAPLPAAGDGPDVDALEALCKRRRVRAIYAMPTLHNPLGCVMPDAEKERLVRTCERHDVALIEDDTYADMASPGTTFRAAKSWCRTGHVIYCHSLNKNLAPGLRLGWMLPGRWQARIDMLKYSQNRYSEELPQMSIADFLAGPGWDRHLNQLRTTLKRQRERYVDGVAQHFPPGTRLSPPEGGMLLWIELPGGISGDALFEAALDNGIKISPGSMFSNARRFDHFIRIAVGTPYGPEVDDALRWMGAWVGAALR